jgi:hypothetical protein
VNAIPDKFARWNATYLLRARSPAEHREFEEHLASAPTGKYSDWSCCPTHRGLSRSAAAATILISQTRASSRPSLRGAGTLTSPTGRWEGKPPVRCRGRPDW